MRKFLIVAGLLLGTALLTGTSSTPAQAWVGCVCAKVGAPAACVEGPGTCTLKNGGVCVLPCAYNEPAVQKPHRHHHKKKK